MKLLQIFHKNVLAPNWEVQSKSPLGWELEHRTKDETEARKKLSHLRVASPDTQFRLYKDTMPAESVKESTYEEAKIGDRVRIAGMSMSDENGKQQAARGTLMHPLNLSTTIGKIPTNVPGRARPFNAKSERVIHLDVSPRGEYRIVPFEKVIKETEDARSAPGTVNNRENNDDDDAQSNAEKHIHTANCSCGMNEEKHPGSEIIDIERVKEKHRGHFFDPDTMRVFDSRVSSIAHDGPGGRYFSTSEKGPDNVRRYSVRRQNADGNMDTIGAFGAYSTLAKAENSARELAGGKIKEADENTNLYSKIHKQYTANEDENKHSENAVLLAKHFGTEAEHAKAKRLVRERDKLGHAPDGASQFQYEMSQKYYPKLHELGTKNLKEDEDMKLQDLTEEKWSGAVTADVKSHPKAGLYANGSAEDIAKSEEAREGSSGDAIKAIEFYKNRAGDNLSSERRGVLDKAISILQNKK